MYLQMQQNSEVNIMILCKFVLKQMVLFCQGSGKEYTVSLWVSGDENHDKVDRIFGNFFKCCKNLTNTSYGP